MQSWFIWNGKNSREMGLWVNSLPGETRATERATMIKIPGRSGHLTLLEGNDIYNSYLKECTVLAPRDIDYERILNWLTGEGEVIFSSNQFHAYDARISSEVSFSPITNTLCQAVIPFFVQPLKHQVPTESDISITAGTEGSIYNPGTVASKPLVTMSGNKSTLTIAGKSMSFTADTYSNNKSYAVGDMVWYANTLRTYRFKTAHASGGSWDSSHVDECTSIKVDCESKMIIAICNSHEYPYTAPFTGEFWEIPVGTSAAGGTSQVAATITPRWRWR